MDSSVPLTTAETLLNGLLPEWHLLLQGWAADGRLTAAAKEALLLNGEPQALSDLTSQWSAGEFGGLPPIVLLSAADINGAMGAYAISTGTIYLNADWLAGASKEQVIAVLTEELGHHLDGILIPVDTAGDEGEYLARLLAGEKLAAAKLPALRKQDDQTQIVVNGKSITAESAINLTATRPGGENPETLTGTSGDDLIDGFGGDDTISGLAGDDILIGGEGNDIIDGGTGINRLYGDAGNDTITSSGTGDLVDAGEGDNIIFITGDANGGTFSAGSGINQLEIRTGANIENAVITTGNNNDLFTIQDDVVTDRTYGNGTINAGNGLNSLFSRSGIGNWISGDGADLINIYAPSTNGHLEKSTRHLIPA